MSGSAFPARVLFRTRAAASQKQARYPMRAEMEGIVDEIKQAISLLRRHL